MVDKEKWVAGLAEFVAFHGIRRRDGKLVLYKAVSREYGSLFVRYCDCQQHGRINAYVPGMTVRCRTCDTNRAIMCGLGLHVGTRRCAQSFLDHRSVFSYGDHHRRIIKVLVDPHDVVCVPYGSYSSKSAWNPENQKIRCRKLVVVGSR
jgi:hypothetical protein